jgi:hypothetical protein
MLRPRSAGGACSSPATRSTPRERSVATAHRAGIEEAFRRLGDRLARRGVVADLYVFGGAAMALPVPRAQIVDYWTRRQREIVTARGRLPMWTSPSAKPRRPIGGDNLCSYRRHGGLGRREHQLRQHPG